MKKILLLAAIYSLVINQCTKDTRRTQQWIQKSVRPVDLPLLRSQNTELAANDFGFKKVKDTSALTFAKWSLAK